MSKTLSVRFGCFLLAWLSTLSLAYAAPGSATRTLTGTYTWDEGKETGDLTVTFVPLEEARWRVVFREGTAASSHVYSGTAVGEFGQGGMKGRVSRDKNLADGSILPFIGDLTNPGQAPANPGGEESEEDVYTFQGEFKDGRFLGTHASVVDGKEKRTGTMNLGEVK